MSGTMLGMKYIFRNYFWDGECMNEGRDVTNTGRLVTEACFCDILPC